MPVGDIVDSIPTRHGLAPLTAQDIAKADLPGELACGFADRAERPLLYAAGDVQSDNEAVGVAKVGRSVERITVPGGFSALVRGPTLTGTGMKIVIRIDEGPSTAGESPPRPASMTIARDGQPDVGVDGTWTCGP